MNNEQEETGAASEDDRLEVCFKPFSDDDDYEDFDSDLAYVQAQLVISPGEEQLRLAEELIAHYREHDDYFHVPGTLMITHDDESLPPSAFNYDLLPAWLKQIVDTYRKYGGPDLLKELDRLRGLVMAVESKEPDSYFDDEQNAHRAAARAAQDEALGSRRELREKLKIAHDALAHYAEGPDGLRARSAIDFMFAAR